MPFDAGVWAPDTWPVDVMRYFATVLDRLPDSGGLAFDRRPADGMTLSEMAEASRGERVRERYGALSNEGFVEQLYRNALDREGRKRGAPIGSGSSIGRATRADVWWKDRLSLEMYLQAHPRAEDGLDVRLRVRGRNPDAPVSYNISNVRGGVFSRVRLIHGFEPAAPRPAPDLPCGRRALWKAGAPLGPCRRRPCACRCPAQRLSGPLRAVARGAASS